MAAFMVPAKQKKRGWVSKFVSPQKENAFDGKVASVDIIAQEQVASRGWIAAHLEKLQKIIVLSMNIATDCHRTFNTEQGGLFF
jgi:hypothetical protein